MEMLPDKDNHKKQDALSSGRQPNSAGCEQYHKSIFDRLEAGDVQVSELVAGEYRRVKNTIQLIAAENQCSRAVLAALGSVFQNKTTEGFPGARLHGGSDIADSIERLATERARKAFGARYANVQPHSGTQANQIVLTAVLQRGDRVLSLGLEQGGHFSHGSGLSFSGKFFDVENYGVDKNSFLLDYDSIAKQAERFKPKLIISGATAYSRPIDFKRFRRIAESIGAYLLADISHISALVMAGAHQSPIDYAHFTTTSTYKPGGPRGGLILMGKDFDKKISTVQGQARLAQLIDETTFPGVQGTPYLNNIAAKAVFLKETLSDEYRSRQFKIIENARALAAEMMDLGYDVLTGGTDNHMVLINVADFRQHLTGLIAQRSLEQCGIVINMNRLPFDDSLASVASGIRLGTPIVTKCKMGAEEMKQIAAMIDAVLRKVEIESDSEYRIDQEFKESMLAQVQLLCSKFPMFVD